MVMDIYIYTKTITKTMESFLPDSDSMCLAINVWKRQADKVYKAIRPL
jgi:hypothetical protein